ncbi:MmgE/PrpD family protein [Pararoseomonas indoligenes]|uniref:MmgE/PrpD family protein n=1 Tax=Roseomonas indoligenes TaxID=2820811 RepID=A0A940N2J0_9PROT|nr:MmgE/PrpD family protein [Pararoseomonas indoligenes]
MFGPTVDWAWNGPPPGSAAEHAARLLLLDSLGCALAGLAHGRPRAMAAALAPSHPGVLRLPGCPPLGPAGAAAVLAAAMPWDEANEGLARSHGRPGLAVAPLAVAALLGGATLGEGLSAYALGYEIAARAGEAWRIRPGMHVDGAWHSLGAAAASAQLGGGDPAAASRAVRIAACQIPFSLYAPISAGMDGRNTYPAHAVMLGSLAGAAAVAGLDAPESGFATARETALGLSSPAEVEPPGIWLLEEAYIKPFAGVRHAHYAAAAALALRPHLGGTMPRSIRLHTYAEALQYAGNRAPAAPITAQFSLSWAVAAALLQGDLGPAAYTEVALADPRLRAMEAAVELLEDHALPPGRRGARLELLMPDGRSLEEAVNGVTGDPDRPMTAKEAAAKFRRYAGTVLSDAAAEATLAALLGPLDARPGNALIA